MRGDLIKWAYSFVLLGVTIWWGVFCVNTVMTALQSLTEADVLMTAGVSVLMGALISWDALIIQHWFRKKTPE